jgi:tellurite resistance protein
VLGIRIDSTPHTIEGGHVAGKTDFTADEWKDLQQGVTGAGMLVSTAHRDFTDSFGEASTVAKQLAAHRESESQLVRELSEAHSTGFGLVASPKEVVGGTINALGAAVGVLGAKAPDELEAYRGLVLDVATAVAEAKGGVKDEETAAIERITAALGAV